MGAPRRWIKQLLGLKKSEKIASSEEENNSGNAAKSWNQSSKPSVEPEREKSRYENELNENVDTEFEDANWQWEMDQAGAVPSTSLQSKTAAAAQLSPDPPAISPPRVQKQQDWREEWMSVYAKEGNFQSAQDSPNSPEDEEEEEQSASPSRGEDDAVEGWATPDVREMFDSDPDPIENYTPLDGEDANFLDTSNSEEDQDLHEELAPRCIQTAIRGFLVQNEAKTETPLPMSEESAAIRIQTVYRGFKARRGYRAIKGLARLQSLVKGHTVKRQAAIALRCIQALVKVQAHSRAKHVRSALENQSVQKKLIQQLDIEAPPSKKLEYTQNGWCDKVGSAAEVRARWQKRQEAAAKREKARAYALARQWQAGIRQQPQQQQQQQQQPPQQQETTSYPTIKSEWGWKWLERWMAVRPWETDLLDEAVPTRTSEHVPSPEVPTSPLTERKPLSTIGNEKTIPRFNITIEKSPSPRKPVAALEAPTSRSPRTPVKAFGSRSFSTPRERSNLGDFQDKKRLSLPGTVHGARLLAQASVNSPRTQSPRVQSPRVQSPRTPQKAGNARSKLINGNEAKPSKLSR